MSLHHFCNKIFNSTKTGKRLIKMVACKRNVLFLPLSFTCLWLGMFSCTWGTQGIFQLTRNLCQRGWADFRNADLLMCFLHINYWWTLKHSFLGLYFSRSEANLLQVMSTLSKLEIRTTESAHIGLKLCSRIKYPQTVVTLLLITHILIFLPGIVECEGKLRFKTITHL